MKQERLPTKDVRENRFEREEKLGHAAETLPGKTLRDRNVSNRGTTLRGAARQGQRRLDEKAKHAAVILPILEKRSNAVQFHIQAPEALRVYLAGTFNEWSPTATPLVKGTEGEWRVEIKLTPGTYEYRFVVDGNWYNDPLAKGSAPNPYGGENSVVSV